MKFVLLCLHLLVSDFPQMSTHVTMEHPLRQNASPVIISLLSVNIVYRPLYILSITPVPLLVS